MNNASLIILAVEIIHTEYFSGFPGQDTNILKLALGFQILDVLGNQ